MSLIVVGGQTRDIGKTSVVCGIISALPERGWTAVKITGYDREEYAKYGGACTLAEEYDRTAGTDSSRFLAAGARRSFWLRAPVGQLGDAMPSLRTILDGAPNAVIESSRVLDYLRPDLYLLLLDRSRPDFKPVVRKHLDRADAYLLIEESEGTAVSPAGGLPPLRESARCFPLRPGERPPADFIEFVRARLQEDA